jgi:integrase
MGCVNKHHEAEEQGKVERSMAVFKRGKKWWYKFFWNGKPIRESTKQSNKRTAEQMEAAHKASLAKGEVGIREKKPVPTLAKFLENDFLPFVRTTKATKPNTVRFYENSVANLQAYSKLAGLPLDQITAENIAGFVAHRQTGKLQVSTINRDLATLRRVFHLAPEWGRVSTILPRVRLLSGENSRDRIVTAGDERRYLGAATAIGHRLNEAYQRALDGIRAVKRGQEPTKPDAFLLRDVAMILIDCGLRPEECFRLTWLDSIRDGAIEIHGGKGRGSRRRIPASQRVLVVLEMRRVGATSEWVFPANTRSGHIEASTLKKQHAAALKASGVAPFVLYTFRHTCITRWAKYMDPFRLHILAGHTDMKTTMKYVHMSDADILEAMDKVHRTTEADAASTEEESAIN